MTSIESRFENKPNKWIVYISGELDVSCAESLKNDINDKIDEDFKDVEIDMSNLKYIDSTGVGVIVGVMKKLKSGKKNIKLLNAKNNVRKIFEITGLDQIIDMEG